MSTENRATDIYLTGIDIGSTTAKMVITDNNHDIVFSRYIRHHAEIAQTLRTMLKEAMDALGDVQVDLAVTGSAGMGIAETMGLPFVQEVIASARFMKERFPQARTFIEIGGEDSKIIFLDDNFRPDIRMNGTCAGGTGAFIDQMAVLLDVDVSRLNDLAAKSTNIYPIASRCGVFAKTDIQAMLSRCIPKTDIAASIFHAVALQVIGALSRGREIKKKIVFGGGPLTFYPELRNAFAEILKIEDKQDIILPENSQLIPAMGAAMVRNGKPCQNRLGYFLQLASSRRKSLAGINDDRLPPLFESRDEFKEWQKKYGRYRVARSDPADSEKSPLFMGIDSGSTTTKIVLIDRNGKLVESYYSPNLGDPIMAVKQGLAEIRARFDAMGICPHIARTAATGYGESLIRAAFGLDDGVVETMAHYRAAMSFEPNVSFILDIGGQDMKAVFIKDSAISEIQVNEACSSGCGSFIETFAHSLGFDAGQFAGLACTSKSPFDLGTRCTVFMNSKVKQALREGAQVEDIAAGLAYSVIKNALYKVLKLNDFNKLGDTVVVQGGTFKNPAVLRALELLLERDVIKPDISELMGAYGAALTALSHHLEKQDSPGATNQAACDNKGFKLDRIDAGDDFSTKEIQCRGCENRCRVTMLTFKNGNRFYTGNRCERYFGNNLDVQTMGRDLVSEQLELLFGRETEPETEKPVLTYGIPRCLNIYENFPFWCRFLTACGFRVVLSSVSSSRIYQKGSATVMSENICFPAKLAHGHIFDLAEKKVDRIFYPTVIYEQEEFENTLNSYNCPVVTGYPDLLKSAVNPEQNFGIPIDSPAVSFKNIDLLKDQLFLFFKRFGISYRAVSDAVEKGIAAQAQYKKELKERAADLLEKSQQERRTTVVLAGRPYHTDPLINHGIPRLLTELGVDVISETAVPLEPGDFSSDDVNVLTQWSYTNRLYASAIWVKGKENVQMVHLTSFGCGPDAISTDEVGDILRSGGKIHTLIKMDEITNLGAVKIRLRSMLEAIRENRAATEKVIKNSKKPVRLFTDKDRNKTLIVPYFSPFYSPLIPFGFKPLGYRVEILPPQDKTSVETGLKIVNNDICYPAVLVAGDIIKAFQSGRYDPSGTAVILTQTGGQCRASSYVSLVRKGLAAAGLEDIPLIALSDEEINPQPGFKIDRAGLFKRVALGIIFADPLARMYLATVVREKNPGTAQALHSMYIAKMETGISNADFNYLLELLKRAVADFNNVDINKDPVPRIGVVGEIFVKYNFFAGGNIIEWLTEQGIEVVLPPIQSFFAQRFVNETYNQDAFLKRSLPDRIKYRLLELYTKYHLGQIERVMRGFRFYKKTPDLRDLAEITAGVVSLANQAGEGWLLTAEMIAMLNEGINNIICLQPFGCIANHITGKGIENRLRELFPRLNLLALDMDAGASEVNILNRLHFMVTTALEDVAREAAEPGLVRKNGRRLAIFNGWPKELRVINSYTSLEMEKWRAWVTGLGLWEKARNIKRRISL